MSLDRMALAGLLYAVAFDTLCKAVFFPFRGLSHFSFKCLPRFIHAAPLVQSRYQVGGPRGETSGSCPHWTYFFFFIIFFYCKAEVAIKPCRSSRSNTRGGFEKFHDTCKTGNKNTTKHLAPTGLTREDIWKHLFLTKQRKNLFVEGCHTGEDLEDVKR